jgi:hypothetical protein
VSRMGTNMLTLRRFAAISRTHAYQRHHRVHANLSGHLTPTPRQPSGAAGCAEGGYHRTRTQGHDVGAAITTCSRGRCSGNGLREGRLRVKPATVVVLAAAASALSSSSVAVASSSSSSSTIWSSRRAERSERGPKRSRFSF